MLAEILPKFQLGPPPPSSPQAIWEATKPRKDGVAEWLENWHPKIEGVTWDEK